MTKEMKKWVRKEFPQKAERIIRKSLSQGKIEAAGIRLKKHEIFVQVEGHPKYFGSNYGRLISLKRGTLTLMAETTDSHGYVVYTLSRPALKRRGKKIGDGKPFSITGHRLVADLFLFLPNYWIEMTRRKLETHHLDHNRRNNRWTNLIIVPVRLHNVLNKLDNILFYTGKSFKKTTPYEIQKKTDMTLEEILLPYKRQPDMVTYEDGHEIRVYDLGGYFIGMQPTENALRAEARKQSKKK